MVNILNTWTVILAFLSIIALSSVNALFWMILTFLSYSLVLILIGYEFVGLMMIIIYIGAICVLLLFVAMIFPEIYLSPVSRRCTYFDNTQNSKIAKEFKLVTSGVFIRFIYYSLIFKKKIGREFVFYGWLFFITFSILFCSPVVVLHFLRVVDLSHQKNYRDFENFWPLIDMLNINSSGLDSLVSSFSGDLSSISSLLYSECNIILIAIGVILTIGMIAAIAILGVEDIYSSESNRFNTGYFASEFRSMHKLETYSYTTSLYNFLK